MEIKAVIHRDENDIKCDVAVHRYHKSSQTLLRCSKKNRRNKFVALNHIRAAVKNNIDPFV